ncbi:MAG: hypothetical protein BGN96_17405 [Bacteroidales bacterium 45-6]|nr:MAG: hypothetical protein BGN96_17405 [Bacteroidales bacterium 45-6]
MGKAISSAILLSILFCIAISAKRIAVKGIVQDEYGRPVNNIAVSIRDTSYGFGSSRFNFEINQNDTLHFAVDEENKKDTLFADPEADHVVRVKLSVDSSGVYYWPLPPNFQSGDFSIEKFLKNNLRYPEDALRDSISEVAHVRFRLNAKGEKDNFSVIPSVSPSVDQEAIRLVSLMPKMIPVRKENKYKVANCFIPIRFNINDYRSSAKDSMKVSDSIVAKGIEMVKQPEFPNGFNKLMEFLKKNITYPKDAIKKNVSAKVQVKFVVDQKGDIHDITIIWSAYPALDEEAIRVVRKMPRWIPGEQKRGEKIYPCSVTYVLPIQFQM